MTLTSETMTKSGKRVSPARRQASIIIIVVTVFITATCVSTIPPMLPLLGSTLNLTVAEISWIFTTILLAGGVGTLVIPRAADVIGDKWAVMSLPVLVTVGCSLVAFANGFFMLIVAAAVLGLGVPGSVVAMSVLRRLLGEAHIGRAVSAATACAMIGAAIGGIAAGTLAGIVGLLMTFVVLLLISAASAVAVFFVMPNTAAAEKGHLGLVSIVLLVLWVVAILFGVSQGPAWGWLDVKTLGVIGGGIAVAMMWALRERRLKTPLVDFSIFRERAVSRAVLTSVLIGYPIASLYLMVPMITQLDPAIAPWGLGLSALGTALIMGPYSLAGAIGATVSGFLLSRGLALTAAAIGATFHLSSALLLANQHGSVPVLLIAMVIYGLGLGLISAGLHGSVQRSVVPERAGMGAGVVGLTQALAVSVGPIVVALLLGRESMPGAPGVPTDAMITEVFFVAAGFEVLVIIACSSGVFSEMRTRQMVRATSSAVTPRTEPTLTSTVGRTKGSE